MPLTFVDCDRLFRNDDIGALAADSDGVRYLKIRSLNRREALERLFDLSGHVRPVGNAAILFRVAFESDITAAQIEACMREIYGEERATRREQEPDLINQLYRLQEFNWEDCIRIAWKRR